MSFKDNISKTTPETSSVWSALSAGPSSRAGSFSQNWEQKGRRETQNIDEFKESSMGHTCSARPSSRARRSSSFSRGDAVFRSWSSARFSARSRFCRSRILQRQNQTVNTFRQGRGRQFCRGIFVSLPADCTTWPGHIWALKSVCARHACGAVSSREGFAQTTSKKQERKGRRKLTSSRAFAGRPCAPWPPLAPYRAEPLPRCTHCPPPPARPAES